MNISRSNSLLIGIAVLLLIPVVLAAISPLLAPIPAQASGWTAPPLPERDEPLPDFQHLIEPLPIVVRDLPDAASQDVVAIYDAATLTSNRAVQELLGAASNAIPVPEEWRGEWNAWVQFGEDEAPPRAVLESLQNDPQNADRLSNLAAVIFYSNRIQREYISFDQDRQAWSLLEATLDLFPENRSAFLNYALVIILERLAADRTVDFAGWLAEHPDDATALTFAVEIVANDDPGFNLDPATLSEYATALSQSSDAARAALGHALLGDLQVADFRLKANSDDSSRLSAPYDLQRAARRALEHYDVALQLSDDSSIYAARALMLSILGDVPGAVASQQRAVDFQPDSLPLKLQLADHYLDLRGSVDEARESVETAREIEREALAGAPYREEVLLSEVRFVSATRDLVALVANHPAAFYTVHLHGGAGGGYEIAFTEIPLYGRRPAASDSGDPLIRADFGIFMKSQALGDVAALGPDANESAVATARLVADHKSPSETDLATGDAIGAANWLRFLGSNKEAMELCRAAKEVAVESFQLDSLERCIGESAYLAGDYKTAQHAFEAIDDLFMAGYVAHRRGDFDEAERLLRASSESQPLRRFDAMQRLGDIHLDAGRPGDAVLVYDEWLAWAETGRCRSGLCQVCPDGYCIVVNQQWPRAYSNRGIARLQE
ncbi:MAG: hypothetical protein KF883_16215, partial [Thermomicrobiales bacterium]|nr:hypothetical protein [Thermomicrobiales bacterium]